MSNSDDYYQILGVDKKSDDNDIKKAYRKLAMKWHPDKQVNKTEAEKKKAEDKFKRINEAYEILSDPKKRQQYDLMGNGAFRSGGGHGGYEFRNASDVFSSFFGGNNPFASFGGFETGGQDDGFGIFRDANGHGIRINIGGSRGNPGIPSQKNRRDSNFYYGNNAPKKKGDTKVIDIEVSLEQLYSGGKIRYPLTRTVRTGRRIIENSEVLTINVMPGWKEGTKITFSGKGDIDSGIEPGDIIFTIKVKEHDRFVRIGNDLQTQIDITLDQALNGFMTEIKCLNGHNKVVSLPNGINETKYTYRILGEGMPVRKEGKVIGTGDLLVGFNVLLK